MKIAIDGNIGSGKSFYLRKLEHDGFLIYHENTKKWTNWLEKYNNDMKRWALGFQLQILLDQCQKPYEINDLNIYERSPYTLKNVFGDLLNDQNLFDPDEYKLHNQYVQKYGWEPDIIIYLYCDHRICFQRIKQRNKEKGVPGDDSIPLDYLRQLHLKHEAVFDEHNCDIPIYKINSQEDPETVYRNILDILTNFKQKSLGKKTIRSWSTIEPPPGLGFSHLSRHNYTRAHGGHSVHGRNSRFQNPNVVN